LRGEPSFIENTWKQMNKAAALRMLNSTSAHDRLIGARFLANSATVEDLDEIDRAIRKENVFWVRNALRRALRKTQLVEPSDTGSVSTDIEQPDAAPDDRQIDEVYSNALYETTSLLLHEIEPLFGRARLYAKREIPDFEGSKTKRQLDLLDSLMEAIAELRSAASPAKPVELDLSSLMREVADQHKGTNGIDIQLAGPSPFVVLADRGPLLIAITNGLRNAIEATQAVDSPGPLPIVINWNRTEQDHWVSIIDNGAGLKASLDKIFEIGSSSKRNHLGMGLPAARRAASAMGGDVRITPRDSVGVQFEIRWPRFVAPL
jgi:signal transduction histidine kinase